MRPQGGQEGCTKSVRHLAACFVSSSISLLARGAPAPPPASPRAFLAPRPLHTPVLPVFPHCDGSPVQGLHASCLTS